MNLAPMIVEWDDNLPKEVEDAKKVYQAARAQQRTITTLEGALIEHFHPRLLGFRIEGPSLASNQFAARFFNETGDETLVWDSSDSKEVKEAAERFTKYLNKGYRAFAVSADGALKRQITHFNADLEEITFVEVRSQATFTEKVKDFIKAFAPLPAPVVQVLPPTYPG